MGCSPSGSSVHEILQERILEWVAISFSRGSSPQRRDWTRSPALQADSLPSEPPRKPGRAIPDIRAPIYAGGGFFDSAASTDISASTERLNWTRLSGKKCVKEKVGVTGVERFPGTPWLEPKSACLGFYIFFTLSDYWNLTSTSRDGQNKYYTHFKAHETESLMNWGDFPRFHKAKTRNIVPTSNAKYMLCETSH